MRKAVPGAFLLSGVDTRMRVPDLSSLRRVAVPLAFGGNSEQQHTYFAELHRVGMVTQALGIIAFSLTWLLMPPAYEPQLQHAVLALLGMLCSLVVRYRCTTLPVLTITGACAVLALTFGLRTMADAVEHASFWVLPVGSRTNMPSTLPLALFTTGITVTPLPACA